MFDRKKCKDFARIQLRKRWMVPVVMTAFTAVVISLFNLPSFMRLDFTKTILTYEDFWGMMNAAVDYPGANFLSIVESIVEYIVTLSVIHVYIKMSRSPNPVKFGDFIEGFSAWWRAVLTGLWASLFIFLWSLLLFIPGIVKSYAYSQMFYLAEEFPDVSVPELMNLSKKITKGHKMDLFILDLSFLGWFILSAMSCGIAGLWVVPYYHMTKVNAFHSLLKDALENGTVRMEELRNAE